MYDPTLVLVKIPEEQIRVKVQQMLEEAIFKEVYAYDDSIREGYILALEEILQFIRELP